MSTTTSEHALPSDTQPAYSAEELLTQMEAALGAPMVEAVRKDPCFAEFMLALRAACALDGDAQAIWEQLENAMKTGNGRGRVTSVKMLLDTLPEVSPVRRQMNTTLERLDALVTNRGVAVSPVQAVRTAPMETVSKENAWQQSGRGQAVQELQKDAKLWGLLSAVVSQGEIAVRNMAENESARSLLCGLLMMESWDAGTALKRLQEVQKDIG